MIYPQKHDTYVRSEYNKEAELITLLFCLGLQSRLTLSVSS